MALLALGIFLWWAAHLFKRAAPGIRQPLGERGKGIVALGIAAGVVLMILGYRSAEVYDLWLAPDFFRHINNLLVLIAIYMLSPAPKKGVVLNGMRHPQLTGFALWAAAHLLVNSDPASLLLFGGLAAWAIVEIIVINRAEPDWTRPEKGTIAKDAMFFAASIVLMGAIGMIHGYFGPSPFPS